VVSQRYLDPPDHLVKQQRSCPAYRCYVDDMVLCSASKGKLWHWKQATLERLATLRLTVHPQAQVSPA